MTRSSAERPQFALGLVCVAIASLYAAVTGSQAMSVSEASAISLDSVLASCEHMRLAPYVFRPPEKFDAMVNVLTALGYVFQPLGSIRTLPADPEPLRAAIPANGSLNVLALHRGTARAR